MALGNHIRAFTLGFYAKPNPITHDGVLMASDVGGSSPSSCSVFVLSVQ